MHRSRRTLVLLFAALLVTLPFAPARAADHDAQALLARILDAYGGRAAIAKVRAYRLEGEIFSAMRHETAPTTRIFARPARLKVLLDYAKGRDIRLLDGERGWRSEGGAPVAESHGPMLDAMKLQAARADVPWILAEQDTAARLIAPQVLDGDTLLGIELPLAEGLALRVYADPRTHLVRVSQGLLDRGPMHTHFETIYSDFRRVQGVMFAFHEDTRASGTPTGVTTVKRIVIDPKLAEGEFAPPAVAAPDSTRRPGS